MVAHLAAVVSSLYVMLALIACGIGIGYAFIGVKRLYLRYTTTRLLQRYPHLRTLALELGTPIALQSGEVTCISCGQLRPLNALRCPHCAVRDDDDDAVEAAWNARWSALMGESDAEGEDGGDH